MKKGYCIIFSYHVLKNEEALKKIEKGKNVRIISF